MSRKKKIVVAVLSLAAIGAAVAVAAPGAREWRDGRHGRHGGERMDMGMPGGQDGDLRRGWFGRSLTQDDHEARVRERFARLDANSDGILDRAEIEKSMTERGGRMGGRAAGGERGGGRNGERSMLPGFDTDRDGKITREEFLARVTARFAEADLDGDGRITDADLPPMMRGRNAVAQLAEGAGRERSGRGRGRGEMGGLGFLQGVEVKDGAITRDAVLAQAGRAFDRLDADKNGVVDAADRDVMRQANTDYRVRRFVHAYGGDAAGQVTREQFFTKARQRFAERDVNGDGRVGRGDDGGRPGWRERMQERREGGAPPQAPQSAPQLLKP